MFINAFVSMVMKLEIEDNYMGQKTYHQKQRTLTVQIIKKPQPTEAARDIKE